MNLEKKVHVFLYEITISPDVLMDSFLQHQVFRLLKKRLEGLFGLYVISGRSLFCTLEIAETLILTTNFRDIDYVVKIDASTKHYFEGQNIAELKMGDRNLGHNLVNILIKQAFRETNLRQIGKNPRFFDLERCEDIKGSELQMWPGFRAAAYNYSQGFAIVVDNVTKFMTTKSCLERINEIRYIYKNDY